MAGGPSPLQPGGRRSERRPKTTAKTTVRSELIFAFISMSSRIVAATKGKSLRRLHFVSGQLRRQERREQTSFMSAAKNLVLRFPREY